MEIFLLFAAILVLVGGLAVVVVNRRREGGAGLDPGDRRPGRVTRPSSTPPAATVDAASETTDPDTAGPETAGPETTGPETTGPETTGPETTKPEGASSEAESEPAAEPEPIAKPSFFDRLARARSTFSSYLGSVLSRSDITAETWEELEEALIRADVGVALTTSVLDDLRATVKARDITTPADLIDALKSQLKESLASLDRSLRIEDGGPNVWLFVGVNGVGKTTSIGKVAKAQVTAGRSVIMAAGDTFRAAAAEQLETWSQRAGTDFHRGEEGGDPSSVIFDAVAKAGSRDIDLVLADTAGRLHTKSNLMDELAKVRRVADRDPGNVTEVLLVLDATTGQNGLAQARQFSEATDCTGVILTKLDGSAKGGIALAIAMDPSVGGLGLPIKLVGLGEQVDDLVEFDPDEFVDALFQPA